ncbi:MAG: 4Fe-4S binding protein [Muribaculaceae bacterium]|nr:4Fe-4S binding protein [Muribaculaceae bacterium]
MRRLTFIYFSATGTTQRCARIIGESMGITIERDINLACNHETDFPFYTKEDVVVVAVPVYGGRVPEKVAKTLGRLRSNGAEAVIVAVYGNRDYDDALLELRDIISSRGFLIIGAAATVAQHAIFPKVAAHRPDKKDVELLEDFAKSCRRRMEGGAPYAKIDVKGNFPYKKYGGVPLHPKGERSLCTNCGECVIKCPEGAIDSKDPCSTDKNKCISCCRCIAVCPREARKFSGIKYTLAGKLFVSANSSRKEPEFFIAV